MAARDDRNQFRSSDFRGRPDTWKQRSARPRVAIPPPLAAPPKSAEPQPETPVALARIAPPQRPEPDEDGKRDCARGEWCSGYEIVTEDGTSRRRPARCFQPFCPKDRRLIETDLSQMPAQFVHLAAEIGNPVKNGQVIRMPFGPRIPIRIDIDTLMRAIEESLSSWHERVADADHLSYPLAADSKLQRQMVAVRNAERVLVHRVDALLALEPQPMERTRRVTSERDPKGRSTEDIRENEPLDGTDAGMEIFTLRYLCRAVLGETNAKPEKLLGVPCRVEDCDKLALVRAELPSDPDAPVWWSECTECGDRLTEDEYRDWTVRYARWAESARKVPATLENLPGVA
jgi:hypothetical protein